MFTAILITIIMLGLLVFVHEFGHFIMAKRANMQVDEFGFGFPPRLLSVQRVGNRRKIIVGTKTHAKPGDTIYSINLIPLGGFVKIVGENGDSTENENSFTHKSFFARLSTLLAGVIMNVILAWALLSVGFVLGLPAIADENLTVPRGAVLTTPRVTVLEVEPQSPAYMAGLRSGDIIETINGRVVSSADELQQYIVGHKGEVFEINASRGKDPVHVSVASRANPAKDQGPTGIALGMVGTVKYHWYYAPVVGFKSTMLQLRNVVGGLYSLVTGHVALDQLGGPAKIAQLTGQASELGWGYLIQFSAFLSLNLAVFNTLPIPALDGGRVLFLLIEKIRGRKNNQIVEGWVNTIGFFTLLLLILAISVNDVRNFGGLGHVVRKLFGS